MELANFKDYTSSYHEPTTQWKTLKELVVGHIFYWVADCARRMHEIPLKPFSLKFPARYHVNFTLSLQVAGVHVRFTTSCGKLLMTQEM